MWDGEEIDGRQALAAVLQKCFPSPRRWPFVGTKYLLTLGFADFDTEFQQFAMDLWGVRQRILTADAPNSLARLNAHGQLPPAGRGDFSRSKKKAEPFVMPNRRLFLV